MNIDKNIKRIARLTAGTGALIHATAMAILVHAQDHNDPRKLTDLLKALHASARPAAFKAWVEANAPIVFNGDGVAKMIPKDPTPWNLERAAAEPYWSAVEVVGKNLTLAALIKIAEQMQTKLDKALKDDKLEAGEDLQRMRAFVNRIGATAADFKKLDEAPLAPRVPPQQAANELDLMAVAILDMEAVDEVNVKAA
jgi:hypothetical protein